MQKEVSLIFWFKFADFSVWFEVLAFLSFDRVHWHSKGNRKNNNFRQANHYRNKIAAKNSGISFMG